MSRLSRLIGALVALGVVASIAVGGCLPTAQERMRAAASAVSKREAARVLARYSTRVRDITGPADQDRIQEAMSGPIAAVTAGRLKIDEFQRSSTALPAAYSRTAYWLPESTGGVPWFVVSAAHAGAAERDLMLFSRADGGRPFTAAYVIRLGARTVLPRVHGGAGRARAVAPADARLAVRPDALATMHANIEQYGPSTPAARSFEPSEWTTAVHATVGEDSRKAKAAGYAYRRTYHDSGYPVFALRTADGGALVWYAVSDELSVSKSDPSIARAPLKLTKTLAGVVGVRRVRRAFQAVSVRQYVAYVPPRGRGKARVLASDGGPVGGVGR